MRGIIMVIPGGDRLNGVIRFIHTREER